MIHITVKSSPQAAKDPGKTVYTGEALNYMFEHTLECPLDHTPNAETIAAIEEGRAMLRGEIPCKHFDSFKDFLKALKG
jgi:hypothetical protein